MSDTIRQIIREQWRRRNSANPSIQRQARNLIRVHIQLLRAGRLEKAA